MIELLSLSVLLCGFVTQLTADPAQQEATCVSEYGICYSVTGELAEAGPPGIIITRYSFPSIPSSYHNILPQACTNSSLTQPSADRATWIQWCTGMRDLIDPLNRKMDELSQRIKQLIQTTFEFLPNAPQGRRQRRSIWNLLRLVVPDGRLDAIEESVQTLLRSNANLDAVQKQLNEKMASVMDAMDSRIAVLSSTFQDVTSRLNIALSNITTRYEARILQITNRLDEIDARVYSLADATAISTQIMANLITASSALSSFELGLHAASSMIITPVLIPPEALLANLHRLSASLQSSDYQLLYPVTSLDKYYSTGLTFSPHVSNNSLIIVFTVPTINKRSFTQLFSVTSFGYPIPMRPHANSSNEIIGLFRLHRGVTFVGAVRTKRSDSIRQINRMAEVPRESLHALSDRVFQAHHLVWSNPQSLTFPGCLSQMFAMLVTQAEISDTHRHIVQSQCQPVLRKLSPVQLTRLAGAHWVVVLEPSYHPKVSVVQLMGPDGVPTSTPTTASLSSDALIQCHFGCTIRLRCGQLLHIERLDLVWDTSVEVMDCLPVINIQPSVEITTISYYRDLAPILARNFTTPISELSDDESLSKIRENLALTQGQLDQFQKTDDEIAIQIRTAQSNVKTLQLNLVTLKEHIRAEQLRLSAKIESSSWVSRTYRIVSGIFLAITIGVTILLLIKICFPRLLTSGVMAQYLPLARSQFILSAADPQMVTVVDPVWMNPDLWGLLIGVCIFLLVVIIILICRCRTARVLKPIGYSGATDVVFSHMGALIQTQVPRLTGQQLPPIRSIPKIINLAVRYPTTVNPKCLVQVWVEYSLPRVGTMSFMTAVGTFNCEDRMNITSANIREGSIRLESPGKSTHLLGSVSGIGFTCNGRYVEVTDCPIKLSIPPEITEAIFRIRGLALTCERCGAIWVATNNAASAPPGKPCARSSSRSTPVFDPLLA